MKISFFFDAVFFPGSGRGQAISWAWTQVLRIISRKIIRLNYEFQTMINMNYYWKGQVTIDDKSCWWNKENSEHRFTTCERFAVFIECFSTIALDKTTFYIISTKFSWLILPISDEIHFRPFFEESSQEVTVQEGSTAYFNCKVFNIVNETVKIYFR